MSRYYQSKYYVISLRNIEIKSNFWENIEKGHLQIAEEHNSCNWLHGPWIKLNLIEIVIFEKERLGKRLCNYGKNENNFMQTKSKKILTTKFLSLYRKLDICYYKYPAQVCYIQT